MIAALIRWSIANRFLVLLATLDASRPGACGRCCARRSMRCPTCPTCRSSSAPRIPGQAPQIVENQVTYPLTTTMLSVPGAKTVRGYSFFGDSFVYVLFEDGTDLVLGALARARVPEPGAVAPAAPAQGRRSAPTPPASAGSTNTRWSTAPARTISAQLRALQDWFLKYELKTVPNVAEVASVGGMVRQYQVVLDPDRLRAYNIPHGKVIDASQSANQETGGSVLELGEAEYMVRASRLPAVARRLPQDSADDHRRRRAGAARRCRARPDRARRCAAASPSSTAKAKSPAASS